MLRTLVIISVMLIAACSSMATQQRTSDLNDALDRYAVAMRWAYYVDALSYYVDRDGKRPDIDLEMLDDFSITGYEIKEKTLNETQDEVFVRGEFVYYQKEYGTIKKLKFEQNWWYSEEAKHWFIESDFPVFK